MTHSDAGAVTIATMTTCLLASALAVATASPVGRSHISDRYVIAYHDVGILRGIFAGLIGVCLFLVTCDKRPWVRISGAVGAGGAFAHCIAALIWQKGVPDYIHFHYSGVITRIYDADGIILNVSDLAVILGLVLLCLALMFDAAKWATKGES